MDSFSACDVKGELGWLQSTGINWARTSHSECSVARIWSWLLAGSSTWAVDQRSYRRLRFLRKCPKRDQSTRSTEAEAAGILWASFRSHGALLLSCSIDQSKPRIKGRGNRLFFFFFIKVELTHNVTSLSSIQHSNLTSPPVSLQHYYNTIDYLPYAVPFTPWLIHSIAESLYSHPPSLISPSPSTPPSDNHQFVLHFMGLFLDFTFQ